MKKLIFTIALAVLFAAPAHADICVKTGTITLSWQANVEPDLSHYDVYESSTVDGAYTLLTPVSNMEYVILTSLGEGDHYFKLKAVDLCGNESVFSDPSESVRIDITPPNKPVTITITVVVE